MEKFISAHASAGNWKAIAQSCLEQLTPVSSYHQLGFLYVTDKLAHDVPVLLEYLKQETRVEHWVGTIGIAVCAPNVEYFDQPAASVMLAPWSTEVFQMMPSAAAWLAGKTSLVSRGDAAALGIVHGDPQDPQLSSMIHQLARRVGFLTGGVTSARGRALQIADDFVQNGLSGVVLSAQVRVVSGLTQGCVPIGPLREITACRNNVIVSLDDRPALEVFYEDIGEILARDLRRAAGYISVGLPVRGVDTDDYVVRNIVGVDTREQFIAINASVAANDTLMFCKRDAQSAYRDMQRMLHEIKQRLPGVPRAGIYYSCIGRGRHLFGADSEEVKMISAALGEFPLTGFFANGEISNDRLYGYTGVLAVFV